MPCIDTARPQQSKSVTCTTMQRQRQCSGTWVTDLSARAARAARRHPRCTRAAWTTTMRWLAATAVRAPRCPPLLQRRTRQRQRSRRCRAWLWCVCCVRHSPLDVSTLRTAPLAASATKHVEASSASAMPRSEPNRDTVQWPSTNPDVLAEPQNDENVPDAHTTYERGSCAAGASAIRAQRYLQLR